MKKLLFACAILVAGLGITSCNNDDDATPVGNTQMIGTWKAETITYVRPDNNQTYTHPFDHPMFKLGCATDYLTLTENSDASLKENTKNASDVCEDITTAGDWTNDIVELNGMPNREVLSVNDTELVLKYPITFMGSTLDVTVAYSKQVQ